MNEIPILCLYYIVKKIMEYNLQHRIVRYLIMHSGFLKNSGLFQGKMGIVLFFSHYARYTGDRLYDEFAGELLDDVFEDINEKTPVDFEAGLCGIGWGIQYLLQNEFMEGAPDEILSDIDKKIMEWDVRRITDLSFKTGLAGIIFYVDERIQSLSRNEQESFPFDEIYLSDIQSVRNKIKNYPDNLLQSIVADNRFSEDDDITQWQLGLENGCAGFCLKEMLK